MPVRRNNRRIAKAPAKPGARALPRPKSKAPPGTFGMVEAAQALRARPSPAKPGKRALPRPKAPAKGSVRAAFPTVPPASKEAKAHLAKVRKNWMKWLAPLAGGLAFKRKDSAGKAVNRVNLNPSKKEFLTLSATKTLAQGKAVKRKDSAGKAVNRAGTRPPVPRPVRLFGPPVKPKRRYAKK